MRVVEITVEGGAVHHVECPKGVKVVVKDYDIDGVDEESLSQDKDGKDYIESVWE